MPHQLAVILGLVSTRTIFGKLIPRKFGPDKCPTTAEDREKMKDVPYASAIGSIMYAMLCTRPDVYLKFGKGVQ